MTGNQRGSGIDPGARERRSARRKPARRSANHRKPKGTGHERRAEILAAAKELFLKEGYATVTTRKLAHRVGISQTGLYLYFRSKEAIYEELCARTFAQLTDRLEEVASSAGARPGSLQRIIEAYIHFGLAHPDEYQLTFMVTHPRLVASHAKDMSPPIEKQGPGMRSFLRFRDRIAWLAAQGELSAGSDVTLMAQTILVAAHGLVAFLIARPWYPWVEHERLIDRLVMTVVAGLHPPNPDNVPGKLGKT